MWPVPVVAMEPLRQFGGSTVGVSVGLGVGPFAQAGLDEALGLAIGFGGIGLGADVLEAAVAAGISEVEGFVA